MTEDAYDLVLLPVLRELLPHLDRLVLIGGWEQGGELIDVTVPEIGAFLIHKGATFRRRPDSAKAAKDLHYIVDVMQSSEALVRTIERQITAYCEEGADAAELARHARNHLGVLVREGARTDVRTRLARGIAARHSLTLEEADARAMGFLADLRDLIPEGCGRQEVLDGSKTR